MHKVAEVEGIVRTFLDAMGLSLDAVVTEADDHVAVDLSGQDAYLLLERKGMVLEALQLLMGKVAETRLGLEKRLVVDCQGYRRGQEEELIAAARRTAADVRHRREPMELAPMNPYERRLVHIALKDEEGIVTESSGDGFLKVIVISPV